jgi:hypothetical protein
MMGPMSWFQNALRGMSAEQAAREHGRLLRESGVDRAVEELAGPFGLRRFLLTFQRQGAGVRLRGIEAVALGWGGGPPPEDPGGHRAERIERALSALGRAMTPRWPWSRGAVGYTRRASGSGHLVVLFDEDADPYHLDQLPLPGPPGHPLEGPAWLAQLAQSEAAIAALRQRSQAIFADWESWQIRGDRELLLSWPGRSQNLRCLTLATLEPAAQRYTWRTEAPLWAGPPFDAPPFSCSVEAAFELCSYSAARLGARWLFAQPLEEGEVLLFASVFGP